jgi:hypothetical protein
MGMAGRPPTGMVLLLAPPWWLLWMPLLWLLLVVVSSGIAARREGEFKFKFTFKTFYCPNKIAFLLIALIHHYLNSLSPPPLPPLSHQAFYFS